jgi:hypothetical protein
MGWDGKRGRQKTIMDQSNFYEINFFALIAQYSIRIRWILWLF